ncbi:hypothetical protein HK100_000482 [Physocladia obscura]|uniref:Uncharacterized protein n=1 Tax=Physocladia obscura TaxID=109957 RepID=A0AAD5SY74_9FUNG|nr:hypothetical protein HK100_000482 [Physocladia obscura]
MIEVGKLQDMELSSVASAFVYFEKLVVKTIEKVLEVSPKEVFQQEFSVFAALEFTLFVPLWQIMPHLDRIIEVSGEHI